MKHLDVKVSLIFADPKGDLLSGKKWHFAPLYSLLLKFQSSDLFYRRVLDFELGINVATLDFNGDGHEQEASARRAQFSL